MYSTCIFCRSKLGKNDAIEHFPIGKRLAFDSARGRLWVICGSCKRWNLTPLEERWEAIDESERLFRGAVLRKSTDNIGLTKLKSGLELVRIGKPERPEFAAWRYGDVFRGRWQTHMLLGGVILGVMQTPLTHAAGLTGPMGLVLAVPFGVGIGLGRNVYVHRRLSPSVRLPGASQPTKLRLGDLGRVALAPHQGGWSLRVPLRPGLGPHQAMSETADQDSFVELHGDDALQNAGRLISAINFYGGDKRHIRDALATYTADPDASRLLYRMARSREVRGVSINLRRDPVRNDQTRLGRLQPHDRLALEMATHEYAKHRAENGDLAELEAAWRDAEEVAAISDRLLVSE